VPFRKEHYPPETLAMMYRVLDECVAEIVGGQAVDQIRLGGISMQCAQILLGAVAEGEQDPERLKHIVLQKVGRPVTDPGQRQRRSKSG
jgi:hypothetical protein